ncbi:MAG: M28 family peptidase [Caldilineaceae bacterium]|nr:M28 family peptidase [Caldilineaceae bacterium]
MTIINAIQDHLDHLVKQIGCRMIGTEGNLVAADYIEDVFKQAKLEVRRQSYPCLSWRAERCALRIAGQTVEAIPNTFSPPCQITANMVLVRTIEELERADVGNCLLVLCGELTSDPIMSLVDHAVYLPERDRKIGVLLRQKQPQAIVTVSLAPGYTPILLEDPRLNIPSVTVSAEVGLLITQNINSPASLEIVSDVKPGQTCNVIGVNCSPSQAKRIIMCAHYDTKNGTLGAWDNASGVAALLALAQHYALNPPPVSIEFVAFSAEEYGIEDSFEDPYLTEYGLSIPPFVYGQEIAAPYRASELDEVLAVINFDGIGQLLTANTVATMACSEALKALVREVKQSFPGIVAVSGWPASNHYGFSANGIPSIPLGSVEMKNVLHVPNDTVEWVSAKHIDEVAEFAQQVVINLADKSPTWSRMQRR